MPFDRDTAKNLANLAEHGIDFQDAVRIFEGPVLQGVVTATTMAKFE